MGLYDTTFYLDEAFESLRRGRAEILNPELLVVTVYGDHSSLDELYVRFSGDSYELAEIQITGNFKGGTSRPFMSYLKDKIEENRGNYAKEIFNENIEYDRSERGWWVDWETIGYELENVCIEELMPEVSAELPPITTKAQYKKDEAGYGGDTMYASGQLVECIHVETMQ